MDFMNTFGSVFEVAESIRLGHIIRHLTKPFSVGIALQSLINMEIENMLDKIMVAVVLPAPSFESANFPKVLKFQKL